MFPYPDFKGQFIVSRGDEPSREGTRRHSLETLCVDVFDRLDTVAVLDATGRVVGLFLGTVIDPDAEEIVTASVRLGVGVDEATNLDELIEEHIYRYTGSFIFVLETGNARRIYLDANGSKSLVYDPAAGTAAATTPLLLEASDYARRFDAELYRGLTVEQDGWFPAGLTAHTGIRRLMCNHLSDCSFFRNSMASFSLAYVS